MYLDVHWTAWKVFIIYGGQLECRQLFTNLATHFGDNVIVLSIEGGFHELLGKMIKVAKLDTQDEDKEDVLVRQIKMEVRHMSTDNKNYALEDFTYAKTMEQTSPTLLRFISTLVSDSKVTKASLSLSQSVQYGITKTRNQTTLGLGVKLHHKFGSSDLIRTLNVPYDGVLRFRKSAASYVGDNAVTLHQMMGLTKTAGLIFGWYDNFDLLVSTPNGRRETHAMATEFQMHLAGIWRPEVFILVSVASYFRVWQLSRASLLGRARKSSHLEQPLEIHRESAIQRCVLGKPVFFQRRRRTRSGLTVWAKEMMPWNEMVLTIT